MENLLSYMNNKIKFFQSRLIILFLLIIVSLPHSLLAEENSKSIFNYSITTGIEGSSGSVLELLYNNEELTSLLKWKEYFSPSIFIGTDFYWGNFLLDSKVKVAIPTLSGTLTDLDYLLSDSTDISNYSLHKNYTNFDFVGSVKFGYSFKINENNFSVTPFAGATFEARQFSGQDGYYQYPTTSTAWTGNEEKTYLFGTIISYEQYLFYPYLGVEASAKIKNKNRLNFSISYLPFVKINAFDSHYMRLLKFYDDLTSGIGFDSLLSFLWCPFKTKENSFFEAGIGYKMFTAYGETGTAAIGKNSGDYILQDDYSAGSSTKELYYYFAFTYKP